MSGDDWTSGTDALVLSECDRCRRRWYLPHDRCPNCGHAARHRVVSVGTGTAVAVTLVHGAAGTDTSAGICLVDLDDGVRVMGRAADDLAVGDRVHVSWAQHQPLFRPSRRVDQTD